MEVHVVKRPSLIASLGSSVRKCIYLIISRGPIPCHLAFIMDGNRRFAKKEKLDERSGYRAGFSALMSMLKYCYELGVRYVTIFAFSIDNFRRRPDQIQRVMDIILEKTEGILKEESLINAYGIGVHFVGNLKLLSEPVRVAAEKVMQATAKNTKYVLFICVAYTSTDEIVHSVQESCKNKLNKVEASKTQKASNGIEEGEYGKETDGVISVGGVENMQAHASIKREDIDKQMFLTAPEPDVLIRTSGENRLSNFLLWQTSTCLLYSPVALWPEIGLRHLIWAVINFQRSRSHMEKHKKEL